MLLTFNKIVFSCFNRAIIIWKMTYSMVTQIILLKKKENRYEFPEETCKLHINFVLNL